MLLSGISARAIGRTTGVTLAALGISLVGCGHTVAQFEPVHASGHTGATYAMTSYELKVGPSVLGDAVVWSEGALNASPNDGEVLDLELAIRNTTHTPLNVDVAHTEVAVTLRDGRTQSLGGPRRVGGSRTVAPDSSGRIGLHYALGPLPIRDVKGFAFNWRVASNIGDYAQSTAFVPVAIVNSDSLNDRGLPCTGVYRPVTINECVDDEWTLPSSAALVR